MVEDRLDNPKEFIASNSGSDIIGAPPKIKLRVLVVFSRELILEAGKKVEEGVSGNGEARSC